MSPKRSIIPLTFLTFLVVCSTSQKTNKFIITFGRPSNRTYSPTTQLCCNGIYHEKRNLNISCCGNQTYDRQSQICCGVTRLPLNQMTKCCFDVPYDYKTHNCDYVVTEARLDKDGLKVSTIDRKQKIVKPILEENYSMCGEKTIDLKTHICCNQTAIEIKEDNNHCCGQMVYNTEKNFCCHSSNPPKLLPPVQNGEDFCCNGKPYKHGQEMCVWHNGTITKPLQPTEMLCEDKIVKKEDHICCKDSHYRERLIKKLKKHHIGCCGNSSYSSNEQICCEGELITRDGPLRCCYGSGPYDPLKDTCCRKHNFISSQVMSKLYKDRLGSCCFLNLYDETKEFCCGVSVMTKLGNDQSGCCEYTMDGYEASIDEFVSVYVPPIDEITGY